MIQPYFRTLTVALACIALVAIPVHHSGAQTSSESGMPHDISKQQVSMSDCSQQVLDVSKEIREPKRILNTKHCCANTPQMATGSRKSKAEREKQLLDSQKIEAALLAEMNRSREFALKMLPSAKPIQDDALLMKDEKALSRAETITREGHGMLERGQKLVMTPRL
jgi:hypothetical protein